jgi:hypothetical protein
MPISAFVAIVLLGGVFGDRVAKLRSAIERICRVLP